MREVIFISFQQKCGDMVLIKRQLASFLTVVSYTVSYIVSYLEFVDEIVALQQLVTDVLEGVTFTRIVDGKHVKRPVVHVLANHRQASSLFCMLDRLFTCIPIT